MEIVKWKADVEAVEEQRVIRRFRTVLLKFAENGNNLKIRGEN